MPATFTHIINDVNLGLRVTQIDLASLSSGDELIYREREAAPSERVLFMWREEKKRSPRVQVEFTEGERAGTTALVPGNRIYGHWASVTTVDAYMPGLERMRLDDDLTDIEGYAIDDVLTLLVPKETAEMVWQPVHHATRVRNVRVLDERVGGGLDEILRPFETLEHESALLVSPNASSAIAEGLCRHNPAAVSDWVLEQEELQRSRTRKGRPAVAGAGARGTSAEWEWRMYLESYQPMWELMRSWCGHRAVTAHERRLAAEAEVHRLEVLAAGLIDALRKGYSAQADHFEESLLNRRITAETIRPLVERPLDPSEIPVRIEYRSRGRWAS